MRWMKWIGIAAAIALVVACFLPWAHVSWIGFTVTGVDAGPRLGKPGYAHFVFVVFFLVFSLTPRIWAKRVNLLITALNLSWAIRNFLKIPACDGGLCPDREIGIYLVLASSILMLVAALLPDLKLRSNNLPK